MTLCRLFNVIGTSFAECCPGFVPTAECCPGFVPTAECCPGFVPTAEASGSSRRC